MVKHHIFAVFLLISLALVMSAPQPQKRDVELVPLNGPNPSEVEDAEAVGTRKIKRGIYGGYYGGYPYSYGYGYPYGGFYGGYYGHGGYGHYPFYGGGYGYGHGFGYF